MGFSLVKGKTALSGKSRFFDKAGQKIIRQVPEIGRVLWQISAGCAANRHLELEVATTNRAGAMADDNATPGRPKHKKTTRTPRRKEVLRAEKFYAYEWDMLRVNLLRGFLLAVCDQDGYQYEPEDVVKLNVAEALTEVEGSRTPRMSKLESKIEQAGEQHNGRAAASSSAPVGAAMPPPPGPPQFKAVP